MAPTAFQPTMATSTPATPPLFTRTDPSATYSHYFSTFVICLSGFYALVYVLQYLYWCYRRRRKRAMWLERGRLRLHWHQMMMSQQQQGPLHSPVKERPVTFPSTTTIVGGTDTMLYDRPRSVAAVISERQQSSSFSCSAFTLSSIPPPPSTRYRHLQQQQQQKKKKKKQQQQWICMSKKRRRRLMWQWSVAMGYCRYTHASHMEAVISDTQQRDSEKTDSSLQEEKQ